MDQYPVRVDFSELLGKVLTQVYKKDNYGDLLVFITEDGQEYHQFHDQDCCESVSIEDISGDLSDLVGSPITLAEESTSSEYQPGQNRCSFDAGFTWTFYRIATNKGFVVIRWYGTSNGYYSERVNFYKMPNKEQS